MADRDSITRVTVNLGLFSNINYYRLSKLV
jgi:hypothetical protein